MSEDEAMQSDDSSEDDGSVNDKEEAENLKKAEELEGIISNNKYAYDAHVEIVALYKTLRDLNSMREAYKRFAECFPLTPKLWLEWIRTEIVLATTEDEKENVYNLFKAAVDDYLSVELWQEYAQYSFNSNNFDRTRTILEKALNAGGLDICDGSLLWDFLRELELAQLSLHPKGTPEYEENLQKVVEVFRRQLSVPLLGMENTYAEWLAWLETLENHNINVKPVEWGYQKAKQTLETFKPFEEQLLIKKEEGERFEVYKEYLKIVKDPSTKMCLYERAVSQLCLNVQLWFEYCNYVFKLGDIGMKVVSRALRNCPWSEDLWTFKMKVLENLSKGDSEALQCFEQGLAAIYPSPGLEMWLSYVEYFRRTSDEPDKVDKIITKALEAIDPSADEGCKILRLQARLLAKRGDIKKSRAIWNKIVLKPQHKSNVFTWLEFINVEKQYGDPTYLRTIFQKALNLCKDYAQILIEEWLTFERESGSLVDMQKCNDICKNISYTLPVVPVAQQQENHDDKTQPKGKKRRFETETKVEVKRVKRDFKREPPPPPEPRKDPLIKDPKTTVFVSNITPAVTESKLKEMFPNALKIEVTFDRKGKSRCFAYVQFALEEEVMSALARDREPLEGRPVFISSCKPDKNERKPLFKYSAQVEENKLFVRGLPIDKNQEQVLDIFKPYGALTARLVLHKSGQPKGLAYIEFPDSASSRTALQKTDQTEVDGHVISVAISAPPPKNQGDVAPPPSRHARSRLQVPLIPRTLQVKTEAKATNGNQVTPTVKKSNDDFRKMLMK